MPEARSSALEVKRPSAQRSYLGTQIALVLGKPFSELRHLNNDGRPERG